MTPEDDRTLAEDLACPVDVQPGTDEATPPDWDWRVIGTCQPNAATFHINHSDVGRVLVDALTASDSPPDAPFVVSKTSRLSYWTASTSIGPGSPAPGCLWKGRGYRCPTRPSMVPSKPWPGIWRRSFACCCCWPLPAKAGLPPSYAPTWNTCNRYWAQEKQNPRNKRKLVPEAAVASSSCQRVSVAGAGLGCAGLVETAREQGWEVLGSCS